MNNGWSLKEEFGWIILKKHFVDEVTTLIEFVIVQTLQAAMWPVVCKRTNTQFEILLVCSCHDMMVSGREQ